MSLQAAPSPTRTIALPATPIADLAHAELVRQTTRHPKVCWGEPAPTEDKAIQVVSQYSLRDRLTKATLLTLISVVEYQPVSSDRVRAHVSVPAVPLTDHAGRRRVARLIDVVKEETDNKQASIVHQLGLGQ
jgi:hypothetical protein